MKSINLDEEINHQSSFAFDLHSFRHQQSKKLKIEKFENLGLPDFIGKCNLSNPSRLFILGEYYDESLNLKFKFLGKSLDNQFKYKLHC